MFGWHLLKQYSPRLVLVLVAQVTEYGPTLGVVAETVSWGALIEPSTTEKRTLYSDLWRQLLEDPAVGSLIGAFPFSWGWKWQYTPTWLFAFNQVLQ